jgi:hypothetical protein
MRTVKLFRFIGPEFDSQYTLFKGHYLETSVPPHGYTTRVQVTIPTSSRGLLLHAFMLIMREVVPTTPGVARAIMGIAGIEIIAEVREITSAVGDSRLVDVSAGDLFNPGTIVHMATHDVSNGGAYTYTIGMGMLIGPMT